MRCWVQQLKVCKETLFLSSLSWIAWEMPAPDRDPLCPRKVTLLRGVGAKETDQTKVGPCIRLKLHLVLKFTVTGSPVLNLKPHMHFRSLFSSSGSPSSSVKGPSRNRVHVCQKQQSKLLQNRFGLIFPLLCAAHSPHTPSLVHELLLLFSLPTKEIASQSRWWRTFQNLISPPQIWSGYCFFPNTDGWDDSLVFLPGWLPNSFPISASHFPATAQGTPCSAHL